jgi:hypothetical protein
MKETRGERYRRLWHLHGRGWMLEKVLPFLGALVLAGMLAGSTRVLRNLGLRFAQSPLWTDLPPSGRCLILGTLCEVLGWMFLVGRFKRRSGFGIASFWKLRVFLGEISLIIGGGILLVKATGII